MAKKLTVSYVANACCAIGLDIGRWNACTAWHQYDLSQDKDRVFIRLHDRADNPPLSRTIDGVCRAYDMDAPADGTAREFELPHGALEKPIDEIREWLVPQLLELVHGSP